MTGKPRLHPRGPFAGMPPLWTVYRRPRDQPDSEYYVRLWYGEKPTSDEEGFDTLEKARRRIAECGGTWCLARSEGDDPVIVEAWI